MRFAAVFTAAIIITMKFKDIIDSALFYLSVPKCVGCKDRLLKSERALCSKCMIEYNEVKLRDCSICSRTLDKCSCTNKHLDSHYVHKLIKVFRYVKREDLPSNNLIYSLKRDNRRDVLEFLTNELSNAIDNSLEIKEDFIITNVPRRKKEAKRYGLDHAKLLAKALAKHYSAAYYQPLNPKSKKAQKKTAGEERLLNARFKLKKSAKDLSGKTVVIVDDIVTTGASMGACAMLLKALGAKRIIGAAISIAYKDRYVPLDVEDRFIRKK